MTAGGPFKMAMNFNGTDQGGTLPVTIWDAIPADSPITIEHWLNPTVVAGQREIFDFTSTSGAFGFRTMFYLNQFVFQFGRGGPFIGAAASTGWNHWAATHSGSATKIQRIYQNFVQVATFTGRSWTKSGTPPQPRLANETIPPSYSNMYPGGMDITRIWTVERTAAQLAATAGVILPAGTPGMLAQYAFLKGSGSTLTDYSGNGNHITLYNSPTWDPNTTSPVEK